MLTGEPDQAMDMLERMLARPFYVSRGWLRLDPAFRPLVGHPRFDAVVGSPTPDPGPNP